MATIRAYTTIEQSRKLAKILPLESADMRYGYIAPYDYSDRMYDGGYDEIPYPKDFLIKNPNFSANEYDAELPCWSLGALLEVMPFPVLYMEMLGGMILWSCKCHFMETDEVVKMEHYNNPIEACVAMIEKLHELKML